MRLRLALVLYLAFPAPVAACHRYTRWNYPSPQRCSVLSRLATAPRIAAPRPEIEGLKRLFAAPRAPMTGDDILLSRAAAIRTDSEERITYGGR